MEWLKEYWFIISGVAIPVVTFFVGMYKAKLFLIKREEGK